jgi:23S rRNA (cytidine1920-2'-O)/16S rRNA (cytidine1409-2'-O)-methyltransferase
MNKSMTKKRLDIILVEQELADSRQRAQRLIMAGQVMVDGRVVDKSGTRISQEADITLKATLPYVSRGGLKLEAALDRFAIEATGMIAADVGASTGGFTDCLLQHGASKVYAIDVGYGQLAWRLRQDPRVIVMERVNARYLEGLPEPVDLATVDVSFISLELVLPAIIGFLKSNGDIVALIKPQFEAGRKQVGKGGIVRDPAVHRAVLRKVLLWAEEHGLKVRGLIASPLKGAAGNVEFLAHLFHQDRPVVAEDSRLDIEAMVDDCLQEL